jgi:undecaprenyl-diphosphatase
VEILKQWALHLLEQYGLIGLFTVAFIESSFFPVPPDVLLIAIVGTSPGLALKSSFICTIGSVLGALLGYAVGLIGGRPILLKLFRREKVEAVEALYSEYGGYAVLIAAFTPIPYKIFTIASGVFKLNIGTMLLMSIIGRGARFFLVAYAVRFAGLALIKRIDVFSLAVVAVLSVALLCAWLYHRKKLQSVFKKASAEAQKEGAET